MSPPYLLPAPAAKTSNVGFISLIYYLCAWEDKDRKNSHSMPNKSVKDKIKGSKAFRIFRHKYLLVTLAFAAWVVFIDSNNILTWMSDLKELSAQRRQIEYYREAIRKTDEQLKELRSNRDSLEKFAREQYFFHRPDEEVFIIDENRQ